MTNKTVLVLICVLAGSTARADDKPPKGDPGEALLRRVADVQKSWRVRKKSLTGLHEAVETRRTASRADERKRGKASGADAPPWATSWCATTKQRATLQAVIEERQGVWLRSLPKGDVTAIRKSTLERVADQLLQEVSDWVEMGEPEAIRRSLTAASRPVQSALTWPVVAATRLALLDRVGLRVAATPGTTDLDALVEVFAWEALLRADAEPGAALVRDVSRDLIHLFTERDADGITVSHAGYFVPGRFRDRGFRTELRDGSDQVRHFAWAFRMFAASDRRDLTEMILRLKETRDARQRGIPLNQADLALNRRARRLVEDLAGVGKPQAPAPITSWADRVRAALGGRRAAR